QQLVTRLQVVERGDRPLGNEQHVHRRLRVDVAEGQDLLVLVDDVGRNLPGDDLVEDGACHVATPQGRISVRLPKACARVPRSTYSSSPPSGRPCASRLGRTPAWRASCAR